MHGSPHRAVAAAVPGQHGPAEAPPEQDAAGAPAVADAPALPAPRLAPALGAPLLPRELLPGARPVTLRTRQTPRPDVVVFTAACPACGQDCLWSEERDDTRLRAVVTCPCVG